MEKTIDEHTFYTDGRIYSEKKKRFLTGHTNEKGYNIVKINGVRKGRHQWIAGAFIENPDNLPEVNHINENKSDNRVENLEYCTTKKNCNHGTRNERISKTLTNGMTSVQIAQYTLDFPCELIKVWPSMHEIERELGIPISNVCRCCKGQRKSAGGFGWGYWEE